MINKQEAIDVMECYKRNMEHILGEKDEKVRVIQTCINLVEEAEDTQRWIPVTEGLPKCNIPYEYTEEDEVQVYHSDHVLCVDSEGNFVVCVLESFGHFIDGYGEYRDIVKWMPIPEGGTA